MRKVLALLLLATLFVGLIWFGSGEEGSGAFAKEKAAPAFGGKEDVAFASKLWEAMKGYDTWPLKSDFYTGGAPHGKVLRMYYNVVHVGEQHYHVIIKDNFGGKDATPETVAKSPKKYLAAVTVMVQREPGYDPDNGDWFWVKYDADGSIAKNDRGMALAGRVAKGMAMGCIACHSGAEGEDYLFLNDEG